MSAPWNVITATLVLLGMYWLLRRWHPRLGLGFAGLVLIVFPLAGVYFGGRARPWEVIEILGGVIVLAADLAGKLPDPRKARRKLTGRDSNVLK